MNSKSDSALQSKLETFFVAALQEIYWSEQHLVNVLQTMTGAASDTDLKKAFQDHKEQTATHVQRLEQTFELLGKNPETKFSKGLQGLFDEGWQVIDETEEGSQRDVALIIAAQKVEHYEMACYGSLVTLAKTLGKDDIAQILSETLAEEKNTDLKLTAIAESGINEEASQETEENTIQATTTESAADDEDEISDTDTPNSKELVM